MQRYLLLLIVHLTVANAWAQSSDWFSTPLYAEATLKESAFTDDGEVLGSFAIYISENALRQDTTFSGATGTVIIKLEEGEATVYVRYPGETSYSLSTLDEALNSFVVILPISSSFSPCQQGIACEQLGKEEVLGRAAEIWQVSDATVWMDKETRLTLKADLVGDFYSVEVLELGPQAAELFEVE